VCGGFQKLPTSSSNAARTSWTSGRNSGRPTLGDRFEWGAVLAPGSASSTDDELFECCDAVLDRLVAKCAVGPCCIGCHGVGARRIAAVRVRRSSEEVVVVAGERPAFGRRLLDVDRASPPSRRVRIAASSTAFATLQVLDR